MSAIRLSDPKHAKSLRISVIGVLGVVEMNGRRENEPQESDRSFISEKHNPSLATKG